MDITGSSEIDALKTASALDRFFPSTRQQRKPAGTRLNMTKPTNFTCVLTGLTVLAIFIPAILLAASFSVATVDQPTDYSQEKNWSQKAVRIAHPIDLFFVHPTTYGFPANGKYLADLNDKELNKKTDQEGVLRITDAFAANCNIFAPRYRQVNIEVLKMTDKEKARLFATPAKDIKAAFSYYLKFLNQGRPFILASHSQGSNLMQMVIINNPQILDRNKLVAAYMPGWTFTDSDLRKMDLDLCLTPEQTGCLTTWNTVGPGGKSPTLIQKGHCVNPLSWTIDTAPKPASLNRGARIFQPNGHPLCYELFTAAQIRSDGALQIPSPDPKTAAKLNMPMGIECYHNYDFDFFFNNIKENAAKRCTVYLKNHNPGQSADSRATN